MITTKDDWKDVQMWELIKTIPTYGNGYDKSEVDVIKIADNTCLLLRRI